MGVRRGCVVGDLLIQNPGPRGPHVVARIGEEETRYNRTTELHLHAVYMMCHSCGIWVRGSRCGRRAALIGG